MNNNKYLAGLLFSIAGFVYILFITKHFNLGVSPDSTVYIEVAENYARKSTFTDFSGNLVTHFPPFYPFILAVTSKLLGVKVLPAATYFSAFSLALCILLVNLLFVKCNFSRRSILLLNLLLLLSPAFVVYLMLWSEPLFILLLLIITLLLFHFTESRNRLLLVVAGVAASLLFLTRYAGIGFIGGVVLYFLFEKGMVAREKMKNVLLFTLFAAALPAGWMTYASKNSSNPTNRQLEFHLISGDHLKQLLTTIENWLSPSFAIGAIIVAVVLLYALFSLIEQKVKISVLYSDNRLRLIQFMAATYIAFLFVSISLFDFSTPLDNRMLSPLFPFCLMLVVPYIRMGDKAVRIPYLFPILIAGIIGLYAFNFYKSGKQFYESGIGYTSGPWANSPTIKALAQTKNLTVYTNGQEILQLFLPFQNSYLQLPLKDNSVTKLANENYEREMQAMRNTIKSGKGILVFLVGVDYRLYYATNKELKAAFAGFKISDYDDGFTISAN